jgi:exodeoxyribonuclease VII large subunit
MLFDDIDTKINSEDTKTVQSNVPEFSVSELAFSLKHTVEEHYGHVRVRGEISRVSIPKSGHMYTSLKDDKAVIDAVCWKGVVSKLSIRPEEGLEVICTGKMTTYPGNSRYQLIIESMELAGEGALLKMLEERKKKLAAEGIFDAERKKQLPFLPSRIGVVTSPTGAVIRDILHRLADRFPRDVLLWPVKVQGEGAANEIAKAINGFNALDQNLKPDLIIVARGGGSLEDLMAFNEEIVVRAASSSTIPIISAIGHETDTTLLDYAADRRAPTPTGAAEIAVPVRMNLRAQILEDEKRLVNAAGRLLQQYRNKIDALGAKLGDPAQILELKTQHIDRKGDRLDHALKETMNRTQKRLFQTSVRLTHPAQALEKKRLILNGLIQRTHSAFTQRFTNKGHYLGRTALRLRPPMDRVRTGNNNLMHISLRLHKAGHEAIKSGEERLTHLSEKLELLSFENVLARGYVVIRGKNDAVVTKASALSANQSIQLQFKDKNFVGARVTKTTEKAAIRNEGMPTKSAKKDEQGSLF